VANNFVNDLGLSDFNCDLNVFDEECLDWKHNFKTLADRFFTAKNASPNPSLWTDVYALQLLFYENNRPFFLTFTYSFEHSSFSCVGLQAHPLVFSIPACTLLHGLVDDPSIDLPPLFIVVPIFFMTISTFSISCAPKQCYGYRAVHTDQEFQHGGQL
jgi:hypothetical protein